jgi:hypothetical protein
VGCKAMGAAVVEAIKTITKKTIKS